MMLSDDKDTRRRSKLSVILDDDIRFEVQAVAEHERGTAAGVIRRVLADWARSRQAGQVAP
jgi:hypothetical protein